MFIFIYKENNIKDIGIKYLILGLSKLIKLNKLELILHLYLNI